MASRYDPEIKVALAAGDVAELARIAYQLAAKLEHDDERRERDAKRKKNKRSRMSGKSEDVTGNPRTSVDFPEVQDGSPPREELEQTPPTPRVVRDVTLIEMVDDDLLRAKLLALKSHVGDDLWGDVESFLIRRKSVVWLGWVEAMLRDAGPGSQFSPADLAEVCRDDATLEKPLGSGHILRSVFLPKAREARFKLAAGGERSPPPGAPQRRTTRRDGAPASTPAPPSNPDDEITFQ